MAGVFVYTWGYPIGELTNVWFQAKPADTADLSRLLNDDLAATVARHPKRFVGLGKK